MLRDRSREVVKFFATAKTSKIRPQTLPADRDAALRDLGRPGQAVNRAAAGDRQRDAGPSR